MDRVRPPTMGDWGAWAASLQAAYLTAPWIVGAKICETLAANLSGRTNNTQGVPVGNLFRFDDWYKLTTAWGVDAIAGASLRGVAQKASPDQIAVYRSELIDAAKICEAKGWIEDPRSFHETPPPAPNGSLHVVREHGGRQEAKLVFESGFRPKAELPGSDDYAALKKLHTVEARVLRHTDQGDRPWILFLHGFAMGNRNDLEIAGATRLHELGFDVVTVPYPFHGSRCVGMPGEGALGLDLMTTLNAQAQGLWDVRRVIGWIRENHPNSRIGAFGASMGGFALALLSGLEPLDCAIAVIPAFDLIGCFEAAVRERFGSADARLVRKALAPLDASRFPPKVPSEKTAVVAAIGDGITTPDHAIAMHQHFGGTIDWLVAGHLTAFQAAPPTIERIFRKHLLEGRELPTRRKRRLL